MLYDMLADPAQETNVIHQHPEVVAAMRGAYDDWWSETVPMMINESAPMSKVRPFHDAFRAQSASDEIPTWRPGRGPSGESALPAVPKSEEGKNGR